MNKNEYDVCHRIFEAIKSRPVSAMFWNCDSDIVNQNVIHPLRLCDIASRLNNNWYSSPGELMNDLKSCFMNGKLGYPAGTFRNAAAQLLLNDLENLMTKFQPQTFPSILPLQLILDDFENNQITPGHKDFPYADNKPAAEIFNEEPDPNDLSALLRDIKMLISPDLTAKLALFVRRLQPEIVTTGEDLSFVLGFMLDETKIKVRKYVTLLLRDAASGKIDPFARPFGAKCEKIRITERGMFLPNHSIDGV